MVYTDNGILFSPTKEGSTDCICYNMEESWKHYSMWKTLTNRYVLNDSTYKKRLEQKIDQWLFNKRSVELRKEECVLTANGVSFSYHGNVLKWDSGDGCASLKCTKIINYIL